MSKCHRDPGVVVYPTAGAIPLIQSSDALNTRAAGLEKDIKTALLVTPCPSITHTLTQVVLFAIYFLH